ncbi:MAG: alpha-1,2-fucosyltransferase [bacterium]
MIIIRLKGGLGNQMFQYAFGRALSMRRNEPILLDTSGFGKEPSIDTPREYALGAYNIQEQFANLLVTAPFNTKRASFFRKIKRRLLRLNDFTYHSSLAHSRATFFEGFWNNEKYFKEFSKTIRHEFTLKNNLTAAAEKIVTQMIQENKEGIQTVSLHVRRGDYISNPYARAEHNIVTLEYYEKALFYLASKIKKDNIKIYIFSDDVPWVKHNLKMPDYAVEYVNLEAGALRDAEEMHLMSLCSNNIIANSTYSWWGAWLNRNPSKIVIAPLQWIRNPYINTHDVCPPEWIRL